MSFKIPCGGFKLDEKSFSLDENGVLSVSGGGGTDDVYIVKQITNGATGKKELQGDYAGALAAWQSGKKLKFVDAFNFDGQEVVHLESFSYSKTSSKFIFVCYSDYNFVTYELTASGITGGRGETYIDCLYVTSSGSFFLKSPSNKFFRVSVSDTGELSTEEVHKPNQVLQISKKEE